jgi:hypothetical protein
MNPRCVEGTIQLLDCVFDQTCVTQVDRDYADTGIPQLQTCVLTYCIRDCFPKTTCSALGRCCKSITDVPTRQTCIGTVNMLDEDNCRAIVENVLRPQLGNQFCPEVGAADAGGD